MKRSLKSIRPTVNEEDLIQLKKFTEDFGQEGWKYGFFAEINNDNLNTLQTWATLIAYSRKCFKKLKIMCVFFLDSAHRKKNYLFFDVSANILNLF